MIPKKLITEQPTLKSEGEEEKERSIKSDEMSSHPGIWAVMSFGQTTEKAAREIKQHAARMNSMHSVRKMFHRTEGVRSDPGIFELDKCC
jgi:hypothetical protein